MIVTSDHGEAFGEHGLFLHDASVHDTHLHVPLWVSCPGVAPRVIGDVVSTRDLFGLMAAAASGGASAQTILDPNYRGEHPIALAEHFRYLHLRDVAAQHRGALAAAVSRDRKVIVRGEAAALFAPGRDEGAGVAVVVRAGPSALETAQRALAVASD